MYLYSFCPIAVCYVLDNKKLFLYLRAPEIICIFAARGAKKQWSIHSLAIYYGHRNFKFQANKGTIVIDEPDKDVYHLTCI